jgi:hypothetical protein
MSDEHPSRPGWFPVADGAPGRERWWSGTEWTGDERDTGAGSGPRGRMSPARRNRILFGVIVAAILFAGLVSMMATDLISAVS